MTDVIDLVIFFGGALSLLMAVAQLINPKRPGRNLLLAVFFTCIGVIQLQQYYTLVFQKTPIIIGEQPVRFVKFLIGPVMYLYYRNVFLRDSSFYASYVLHFVPALLSLAISFLMLIFCPSSVRPATAACEAVQAYRLVFWFHLCGIILLFAYLAFLSVKLGIMSMIVKKTRDPSTTLGALTVVAITAQAALLCLSIYNESVTLARWAMLILSVSMITWNLVMIVDPAFSETVLNMIRKKSYERSRAKNNNTDIVSRRIIELMEEEAMYRDDQLTIQKLANLLEIPNHRLSDIINTSFKSNFNSFINRYRVNEAVAIIRENPDCNILSVAYAVGFNSKSVFYDAFTKQTGATPGQFKESSKKPS